MTTQSVALIVLGSALVTFVPRALPMLMLAGKSMTGPLARWLSYVPAALLGALLMSSLQAEPGDLAVWGMDVRDLMAAVPAGIVAAKTRSIILTVVVGILAAFFIRRLIAV